MQRVPKQSRKQMNKERPIQRRSPHQTGHRRKLLTTDPLLIHDHGGSPDRHSRGAKVRARNTRRKHTERVNINCAYNTEAPPLLQVLIPASPSVWQPEADYAWLHGYCLLKLRISVDAISSVNAHFSVTAGD